MSDDAIRLVERQYMKEKVPPFKAGDTVKVHLKIVEGEKERTQVFQGTVIARRGSGVNETFTVRKISAGNIGVERVFLLHSPNIQKIELVQRGKVRKSKLYYLREKVGKATRVKQLRETVESEKSGDKETKEQ